MAIRGVIRNAITDAIKNAIREAIRDATRDAISSEMQSHPRCNLTCRYQRSNWARSRPDASAIARRKSSQVTACPSWRLKYRSIALRKVGQPSKVRYIRITCAQCGHQWSSAVISCHQLSSAVISCHQLSLEVISGSPPPPCCTR